MRKGGVGFISLYHLNERKENGNNPDVEYSEGSSEWGGEDPKYSSSWGGSSKKRNYKRARKVRKTRTRSRSRGRSRRNK